MALILKKFKGDNCIRVYACFCCSLLCNKWRIYGILDLISSQRTALRLYRSGTAGENLLITIFDVNLQGLEEEEHPLVMETSTWVLKNSPDQALRLFESMDPPLPPTLVLSHLQEHAPQLQIIYLEQVMSQYPGSLTLDLQNELVRSHLSSLEPLRCLKGERSLSCCAVVRLDSGPFP